MSGKFELYEDKSGQYRFRLKAANGLVVAVGEGYATKEGAIAGTEAVQRAANAAQLIDLTQESVPQN